MDPVNALLVLFIAGASIASVVVGVLSLREFDLTLVRRPRLRRRRRP